MSGFMVQSAIVYGVNLFTMSAIQCAVYAIEYKVHATNQLLFTGYHHD